MTKRYADGRYQWDGITTWGQLYRTMLDIYKSRDKEAAEAFVEWYKTKNPEHARANLGYLTGYASREVGMAVRKFFGITHPLSDDVIRRNLLYGPDESV